MPINLDETLRIDPADLPAEVVIFGSTPAMREVRDRIDSIRSNNGPVLIQGESGTGKEAIARFLHARSNRRHAPFVKLSCAAIPACLLERELFGCEKSSFSGATEDRLGLVDVADGGTLFLSEIDDMSLELQGKLLRLLRHGSYIRVGEREERMGRARIVCATNIDLRGAAESGAFRADLFDRIQVVSLRLSPLRDRKTDIPQLCEYFLQKLSLQFRRNIPALSPDTMHLLEQWNWPGNLLELKNWVARAIILGDDEALTVELRRRIETLNGFAGRRPQMDSLKEAAGWAASSVTSALILRALQANRWNRRKTAEELNMSYRALLYKLRSVGMHQKRRSHRGPPSAR